MLVTMKQELERTMNDLDGLRGGLARIVARIDEVEALEVRAATAYEAIDEAERLRVERAELERVLPEMRVQREKLQQEVGSLASGVNELRDMLKAASAA